jgi:hypothetical protein
MPLDPNQTAFKESASKDWALLPEDTYQVEIQDISQDVTEWQGQKKDVLKFKFVVIEQHEFTEKGRKCYTYGRVLFKRGSIVPPIPSDNNKDPLTYKVCSAVAGKKLTKEQGEKITIADLNRLIGKQLRIGVSISAPKADGKQFNNVDSFYAAKQQLPAFDLNKVVKDEEPANAPAAAPAAPAATPTPADIVAQASGGKFVPHEAPPTAAEAGEVDVEDINVDDIPF